MGDYIIARATAIYAGKTQAVCRCAVFAVKDAKESLCATAQGPITKLDRPNNSICMEWKQSRKYERMDAGKNIPAVFVAETAGMFLLPIQHCRFSVGIEPC